MQITPLKIGDVVYVYQPRLRVRNTKKKLQKSFHGPFLVVKFTNPKAVILKRVSDGKILEKSVSIQRLKKGNVRAKTNNWDPLPGQVNNEELLDAEDLPQDSYTQSVDNNTRVNETQDFPHTRYNTRSTLTRQAVGNNTIIPANVRVPRRQNIRRNCRNKDFVYSR